MKVICAGISKTGTTTLSIALAELGYNVYDYQENYEYFHDRWIAMIENGWTRDDFREMFEDVDATSDSPACFFWEEMLDAFPDAKVILMTRDNEDVWYESMKQQLNGFGHVADMRFYSLMSQTYRKFFNYSVVAGLLPFGLRKIRPGIDKTTGSPEMVFKQAYRRHNANVLHMCPRDKLLVYNCKDGWEPLCKFLRKEVPEKPFPHGNPGAQLAASIWEFPTFKRILRETYVTSGVLAALGGLVTLKLIRKYFKA